MLGFEVDAINSVQLSNHTGYKVFKGQILNDKDLGKIWKKKYSISMFKYKVIPQDNILFRWPC